MSKIMIVDDHPVILIALRALFEQDGHDVIAESNNGIDALTEAKLLLPDLLVLDLALPTLDGLEVIARLRSHDMAVPVLVFTSHKPSVFMRRCQRAGASGFVWKQGDLLEVRHAVNTILSGHTYFRRPHDLPLIPNDTEEIEVELLDHLSNREFRVLQCLTDGMLNKDIAKSMMLSEKTVSTYKTRLLAKLKMQSLLELIEFGKRNDVTNII
ncbi:MULTISPECIES: response regulator transcription factor [unclassified Undibacterium]|uniref:response regulator transcription factor n=1 Tax=unclassified Undibacterium TaxID=2630295 RepID=UPI002AC8D69D|nr:MULTISPECIES: response regulator transcription factor [unclassified Undibacterium]MEB0140760.1 response regulator transcription factor [Undibacterium sp. CCC2.1]MEB0173953.1 response regulator transcription factor [Undibacterium sp. CCC1.1]MEB0177741.1 response regulator transcription factor [Undibacterium sp. CCC3.4]MEB0217128.1 response regulator transcription factor [Undibacterium sp. 5I2]WPX45553.1 response regulator transcription factor [Undibacterium sp. CCC3.4]